MVDRNQIEAGAKSVLESMADYSPREARAVLRKAIKSLHVARLTNEDIQKCFIPGLAFSARKLADQLGCSIQRIAKVALGFGCTKVDRGVFQAPQE